MSRFVALCSMAAVLIVVARGSNVHAEHPGRTLAVIMTNDPVANQIKVYDTSSEVLLQTLSTDGKGGVGTSTGKFLVVWKKQASGEWKAIIDIDNADQ